MALKFLFDEFLAPWFFIIKLWALENFFVSGIFKNFWSEIFCVEFFNTIIIIIIFNILTILLSRKLNNFQIPHSAGSGLWSRRIFPDRKMRRIPQIPNPAGSGLQTLLIKAIGLTLTDKTHTGSCVVRPPFLNFSPFFLKKKKKKKKKNSKYKIQNNCWCPKIVIKKFTERIILTRTFLEARNSYK